MQVRWTLPAAAALDAIIDYIAQDTVEVAHSVMAYIRGAVDHLAEHPEMGSKGRVKGTRELVVPGVLYIVAYRIGDSAIQTLSVYHAARKWPDRFSN